MKKEQHKDFSSSKDPVVHLRSFPENERGFILLQLSKNAQKRILAKLSDKEIIRFLKYLDLDDATDLVQRLEEKRRIVILSSVEHEMRTKIEHLLQFSPESAAGLMSLDYIEVDASEKVEDVLKTVEKHEKRTGKFPTILVVRKGFLVGELPGHVFAKCKPKSTIGMLVRKIPSVKHSVHMRELPRIFKEHPHDKLVVLDEDKSILGVIYSHDVLKSLDEAGSIGKFAGVNKEEDVFDSAKDKVKYRYKWLIINLATGFLAASVVGLFDSTIAAFVILAAYMPIVAGMGGNAATQTLAVFVRGIALKEIALNKRALKAIGNEVLAGAINGIITGIIAALVAVLWNKSPKLGLIIGVAMVVNLVVAGFFGALIPLVMKRLGKDPASSATIFITTATDVLGFLAFLGLATLLL